MKRVLVLFILFVAATAAAGCVDSMDIAGPALGGMSESSSMLALQVVPDRPAGGTLQGSPVPGPIEARSAGPSADVALVRVVSGPAAFIFKFCSEAFIYKFYSAKFVNENILAQAR
jgi:hypothetical protein